MGAQSQGDARWPAGAEHHRDRGRGRGHEWGGWAQWQSPDRWAEWHRDGGAERPPHSGSSTDSPAWARWQPRSPAWSTGQQWQASNDQPGTDQQGQASKDPKFWWQDPHGGWHDRRV